MTIVLGDNRIQFKTEVKNEIRPNIQSIPQMYLLDKHQKVIKIDGTLEDIQRKLDFLN